MSNRLGIHWIRNHPDDERDLDFVRRIQPASIKLFEPGWGDYNFCQALLNATPLDCIFLARDHPLSEQHDDMWRDPVGTGQRHADDWNEKVQRSRCWLPLGRTYFLGINEPDTGRDRHAIDLYTVAFLDGLRMHGLKGGAFNFSTGHPRTVDGTPNTAPDYAFFEASHQAIVRGGHIAVQHIYGSAEQPCVPGHYSRLKACHWQDVTWVVGEAGIDEFVTSGKDHVGYLGALVPPTSYPQWMEQAIRGADDGRIHSWQIFTYDFSHPWSSYDVREVNEAFVTWGWRGYDPAPVEPESPPNVVHLPIVGNGDNSGENEDLFPRVMEFVDRWEGGFVNNPNDPGGATNMGITIGTLSAWRKAHGLAEAMVEDVQNLTRDEANEIYREWYWKPSGAAEAKDYPTALLLMDSGVLHGVGAPQAWVKEYGLDPWRIAARRLRVYTGSDNWHFFGQGWTNRVAALLEEMGKA